MSREIDPFYGYVERRERCKAIEIRSNNVDRIAQYYATRGDQFRTRVIRQGDSVALELEWDIPAAGTEPPLRGALVLPEGSMLIHGMPPVMMDRWEFGARWESAPAPDVNGDASEPW